MKKLLRQTIQNEHFQSQENVVEGIEQEMKAEIAVETLLIHFKHCSLCRKFSDSLDALPIREL